MDSALQAVKVPDRKPSHVVPNPIAYQIWLIFWIALALRVGVAIYTRYVNEDAMITLRCAENLAQGHGFVFNPGERVLGVTTPLYGLFLAASFWLKLPAILSGTAVNILADCGTCDPPEYRYTYATNSRRRRQHRCG